MSDLWNTSNQSRMKEFKRNVNWFNKNYDVIKEENRGMVVAIDGKVIDKDKNQYVLYHRLKEKYVDIRHIFISYISEQYKTFRI